MGSETCFSLLTLHCQQSDLNLTTSLALSGSQNSQQTIKNKIELIKKRRARQLICLFLDEPHKRTAQHERHLRAGVLF